MLSAMLLSLQMALAALRFTDTTDGELVELYLLTQSERYFGELYQRYGPKVYTRCRTLLDDEHEAHDAVQEVFERVLTRIGYVPQGVRIRYLGVRHRQ